MRIGRILTITALTASLVVGASACTHNTGSNASASASVDASASNDTRVFAAVDAMHPCTALTQLAVDKMVASPHPGLYNTYLVGGGNDASVASTTCVYGSAEDSVAVLTMWDDLNGKNAAADYSNALAYASPTSYANGESPVTAVKLTGLSPSVTAKVALVSGADQKQWGFTGLVVQAGGKTVSVSFVLAQPKSAMLALATRIVDAKTLK